MAEWRKVVEILMTCHLVEGEFREDGRILFTLFSCIKIVQSYKYVALPSSEQILLKSCVFVGRHVCMQPHVNEGMNVCSCIYIERETERDIHLHMS